MSFTLFVFMFLTFSKSALGREVDLTFRYYLKVKEAGLVLSHSQLFPEYDASRYLVEAFPGNNIFKVSYDVSTLEPDTPSTIRMWVQIKVTVGDLSTNPGNDWSIAHQIKNRFLNTKKNSYFWKVVETSRRFYLNLTSNIDCMPDYSLIAWPGLPIGEKFTQLCQQEGAEPWQYYVRYCLSPGWSLVDRRRCDNNAGRTVTDRKVNDITAIRHVDNGSDTKTNNRNGKGANQYGYIVPAVEFAKPDHNNTNIHNDVTDRKSRDLSYRIDRNFQDFDNLRKKCNLQDKSIYFRKWFEKPLSYRIHCVEMFADSSGLSSDEANDVIDMLARASGRLGSDASHDRHVADSTIRAVNTIFKCWSVPLLNADQKKGLQKVIKTVALNYPLGDKSLKQIKLPCMTLAVFKTSVFGKSDSLTLNINPDDQIIELIQGHQRVTPGSIRIDVPLSPFTVNQLDERYPKIDQFAVYVTPHVSLFPGDALSHLLVSIVTSPGVKRSHLKDHVKILYHLSLSARCVVWDNNLNEEYGGWTQQGCRLITNESDTICACDVIATYGWKSDRESAITRAHIRKNWLIVAGFAISSICLAIALISYMCFRQIFESVASVIVVFCLLNLLLSQLVCIANVLIFVQKSVEFKLKDLCRIFAVAFHFYILSSQASFGTYGYYVLKTDLNWSTTVKGLKSKLVFWGFVAPLFIVVITTAINPQSSYITGEFTICWLTAIPSIFGALLPTCIILILNSAIYTTAFRKESRDRSNTKAYKTKRLRGAAYITGISYLNYSLAFFRFHGHDIFFSYIFVANNCLLGFLVIYFYAQRRKPESGENLPKSLVQLVHISAYKISSRVK